ncbi:hypothetical protein SAMN05421833_15210 [Microbispora rosea]|uniref:Uncharacterized protein n=1 Tax=Microbispora rosea TaxID=58117 RepID=A0A1N7HID5_9ACTN|nr:hypothetical protein Mro03_79910 [Microbispora rosea subsp. rosea]SIS24543.1 hypothetical protein SAMN05421833_15210 [Microbispora rosea]
MQGQAGADQTITIRDLRLFGKAQSPSLAWETDRQDLSMWIDVCYLLPDVRDGISMANDQKARSRMLGTGL